MHTAMSCSEGNFTVCCNFISIIATTFWNSPKQFYSNFFNGFFSSVKQVQVNQESLNSFLNVAHKLKIKGLCDSMAPVSAPTPQPPPSHQPHPHSALASQPGIQPGGGGVGQRGKDLAQHQPQPQPQHPNAGPGGNFENLLPRSPYGIQEGKPHAQSRQVAQEYEKVPWAGLPWLKFLMVGPSLARHLYSKILTKVHY